MVRKAYADSIACSGVSLAGTWNPTVPRYFFHLGFRHPEYGSFKGGSGAGTRHHGLELYAASQGYAKVAWRLSSGTITSGLNTHQGKWRMVFGFPSLENPGTMAGVMLGDKAPQTGTDGLPYAGSRCLGVSIRAKALSPYVVYGILQSGSTRFKTTIGSYYGAQSRGRVEFGSFGARWYWDNVEGGFTLKGSTSTTVQLWGSPVSGVHFFVLNPTTTKRNLGFSHFFLERFQIVN